MTDTAVDCFALHFVRDSGAGRLALYSSWHGVIRHVQSGAEVRFTKSDEAIRFLNSYVHFASLDEDSRNEGELHFRRGKGDITLVREGK